ncbi:hypothetical protein Y1Q_0015232 [Alligator mississippiensis]|uniref:Rege-1 UBA-like domain-containing protein n=1 Tax=Alligator mississippiensis TaxID=8496 RepID=A0A151MW39_ALLMI|nr:hypothetical protein Y1Q_0015232 [Alligator mississippiensis]
MYESDYLSLPSVGGEGEGEAGLPSLAGAAPEWLGSAEPGPADSTEMKMRVDFFRKLGYTSEEIRAVLQKLGLNADTNAVLGELVKHGAAAAEREASDAPQEGREAPLVPRGGLANKTPQLVATLEEKESSNLRPVVIDGSNVAMR